MRAQARPGGVRRGGAAGLRMIFCALRPPLPHLFFLILLLMAAPGARAAGYKVSIAGKRKRECTRARANPRVVSGGSVLRVPSELLLI